MKQMGIRLVIGCILFPAGLCVVRAESAEIAKPRDAVADLAASVDRLVTLLERELKARAESGAAERVRLVVEILEFRHRKIEQIEDQLHGSESEEQDIRRSLPLLKGELERVDRLGRSPEGELSAEAREGKLRLELQIKSQEERADQLAERRMTLQNSLSEERRRLSGLESVLDAWMDKQR